MSTSAEVDVAANGDLPTAPTLDIQPGPGPEIEPVEVASEPAPAEEEATTAPEDEDIGEVFPDHYWADGKVPIFKPTMAQFKSFPKFIEKINKYGMQSGIVKVVPPKEWIDSLPPLDDKVKEIRIKNPIAQHIAGSTGIYRQANLQKQKTYNLPQWRALCESSEHQPPARRGERRMNQDVRAKTSKPKATRSTRKSAAAAREEDVQRPLTPPPGDETPVANTPVKDEETAAEGTPTPSKKGRQPKAKRVYVRKTEKEREEAAMEGEEWNGFNYRIKNNDDFTPQRCEELERHYWRTLTYNNPLYGADMPGSLFEDSTTVWNVAHLENILDCLGTKLPGVNTAYLYLGMWKATFSWHLEDVDLYSINYIHFGAPKQWYSISQEDAPRFHAAMKSLFPNDAKKCDQFLRHKTYLASPSYLESHFNIKVNKLIHYEGEFVITFPFGYHAGFNIGYNCAESVNFATEEWLDYGRAAKKCECIDDAVWVDANEIERKLHGLPTESELSSEEEEEEDSEDEPIDLPTPPESVGEGEGLPKKPKKPKSARKRKSDVEGGRMVKKIRVKFNKPSVPVCALCPNGPHYEELLPTDDGNKAHRLCAMYIPETYFSVSPESGEEHVSNVAAIPNARTNLKCHFCRLKQGACFQCSEKKCVRAYHATCSAAAGVLVENVVVKSEPDAEGNTTEKTELEFRCRFHRPKRPKDQDPDALEGNTATREFAKKLTPGDVVQGQLYMGDIFAGRVVENRSSEEMVLLELIPSGNPFEVEWKYILCAAGLKTSPSGKASRSRVSLANVRSENKGKRVAVEPKKTDFYADKPNIGDQFLPETTQFTWQEFNRHEVERNPYQENAMKIWYYLGELSTENVPSWTKDPDVRTADKEALEPHLQRKSAHSDTGPCYPTQAEEERSRMQAMMAPTRPGYVAPYTAPVSSATQKPVPQALHTPDWKQSPPPPPPPRPAGPIASTSKGQKFVIASSSTTGTGGARRVFYSPLQASPYQGYQQTPNRVSYTSATGVKSQSANTTPKTTASPKTTAIAPTTTPSRPVTNPQTPAVADNESNPVTQAPPNVTVQPSPLSSATPS